MPNSMLTAPVKLWEVLKDLGPTCSLTASSLKQVFSDFSTIDEEDILEALLMMCNNANEIEDQNIRTVNNIYQAIKTKSRTVLIEDSNDKQSHITWNFDNFVKACIEKRNNIKWQQVILYLDRQSLHFKDPQDLLIFFRVFKKLPRNQHFQFPHSILFDKWKNSASQAHFLINLIQAGQPDVVSLNDLPKKNFSLENISNAKIASLNPPFLQFICSLEILQLLIELSEFNYYQEIRSLFEIPLTKHSDLLLLGLLQINPKIGFALSNELYSYLLTHYLSAPSLPIDIFKTIWKLKPNVLVCAISELYAKNPNLSLLKKALEIAQALPDAFTTFLDSKNLGFGISLAIVGMNQTEISFESWITQKTEKFGDIIITTLLNYLQNYIIEQCQRGAQEQNNSILDLNLLTIENIISIIEILKNPEITKFLKERTNSRVNNIISELSILFPEVVADEPKPEVETEANRYFELALEEKWSIQELTEKMIAFKNSNDEYEKNIFLFMMTNLLDEARFFANYKPKILMIMAQIYGVVISNDLVEGQTRDLSFKIIVEAIKNKEDKKLYDFGVKALEGFKNRLPEWPTKASQLFNLENLWERNLELLEEIRSVLHSFIFRIIIIFFRILRIKEFKLRYQVLTLNTVIRKEEVLSNIMTLPLYYHPAVSIILIVCMEVNSYKASFATSGGPKEQDPNLKDLQFSNSRIDEMSQNFGNLVLDSNLLQHSGQLSPSLAQQVPFHFHFC